MVLFGVIGIIIKGGIFTYGTTLSQFQTFGYQILRPDAGTLCIQFSETLVLDAVMMVYTSNLSEKDFKSGPFMYRSDPGYDKTMLLVDTILTAIRAALSSFSALLFCPDYAEYFLGQWDDFVFLGAKEYIFMRDVYNLASEYIMLLFIPI